MIRHLIPLFDFCRWDGAALTGCERGPDDVRGWCLCIQWFNLLIEIGIGGVGR